MPTISVQTVLSMANWSLYIRDDVPEPEISAVTEDHPADLTISGNAIAHVASGDKGKARCTSPAVSEYPSSYVNDDEPDSSDGETFYSANDTLSGDTAVEKDSKDATDASSDAQGRVGSLGDYQLGTSRRDLAVYAINTETLQGFVPTWARAGALTQGSSGHGTVRGIITREKPDRSLFPPYDAYSVYIGKKPGVYQTREEAEEQCSTFPGGLYEGYFDLEHAHNLFEFAKRMGWTQSNFSVPNPYDVTIPIPLDGSIVTDREDDYHDELNYYCEQSGKRMWYLVTTGIQPGIYMTHVEQLINTWCVSGAVFNAAHSLPEALAQYKDAQASGDVHIAFRRYKRRPQPTTN